MLELIDSGTHGFDKSLAQLRPIALLERLNSLMNGPSESSGNGGGCAM